MVQDQELRKDRLDAIRERASAHDRVVHLRCEDLDAPTGSPSVRPREDHFGPFARLAANSV